MHTHLTQNQRIELSLLIRLGTSQRQTAVILGVSPSTVCRELARNKTASGRYHATVARMRTSARRLLANPGKAQAGGWFGCRRRSLRMGASILTRGHPCTVAEMQQYRVSLMLLWY
jgi:DNA-binding CsgD family transcriptional regulator